MGAGWAATARQAPQEGLRPFLSALPTVQSRCACAKGKLQLSQTKTQRRNSPGSPGRLWGPHPLHGAPWPKSQGLEGTKGHSPAAPVGGGSGLAGCPSSSTGDAKPPGRRKQ